MLLSPPFLPSHRLWLLVLIGLLTTCRQTDQAALEALQLANTQLVKQLQRCLNQQDRQGLSRLFADEVRCKDATTQYDEVMRPRQQVLSMYHPPGTSVPFLEITQLYVASQHQVVAEGWLRGKGPVCVIYTIEQAQITRQYTY
ncbi:nuclear transport factor 2 family protein [Spirosoma daeguense]